MTKIKPYCCLVHPQNNVQQYKNNVVEEKSFPDMQTRRDVYGYVKEGNKQQWFCFYVTSY